MEKFKYTYPWRPVATVSDQENECNLFLFAKFFANSQYQIVFQYYI